MKRPTQAVIDKVHQGQGRVSRANKRQRHGQADALPKSRQLLAGRVNGDKVHRYNRHQGRVGHCRCQWTKKATDARIQVILMGWATEGHATVKTLCKTMPTVTNSEGGRAEAQQQRAPDDCVLVSRSPVPGTLKGCPHDLLNDLLMNHPIPSIDNL